MEHPMSSPQSRKFKIDDQYWQEALKGRDYYRPDIGFDQYRRAIEFGARASAGRHGKATFEEMEAELRKSWEREAGGGPLTWEHARGAVADAFQHAASTRKADAKANRGEFNKPPTFQENGNDVPRNVDEPNR
jgi:hypothetical protein